MISFWLIDSNVQLKVSSILFFIHLFILLFSTLVISWQFHLIYIIPLMRRLQKKKILFRFWRMKFSNPTVDVNWLNFHLPFFSTYIYVNVLWDTSWCLPLDIMLSIVGRLWCCSANRRSRVVDGATVSHHRKIRLTQIVRIESCESEKNMSRRLLRFFSTVCVFAFLFFDFGCLTYFFSKTFLSKPIIWFYKATNKKQWFYFYDRCIYNERFFHLIRLTWFCLKSVLWFQLTTY